MPTGLSFDYLTCKPSIMPRAGAYLVSDLPDGLTAIKCPKCGRYGRYRKSTLLQRFGRDMPLPDVLNKLADCPKRREWSDPCQVVYSEPLVEMVDRSDGVGSSKFVHLPW